MDGDKGATQRFAFIRSGNWNNGANDGPFTLNLNWNTGNTNNNVGFRCARYQSIIQAIGPNGISTDSCMAFCHARPLRPDVYLMEA